MAVPCWSSWNTGMRMRLAQFRLDGEAFRRLDVLQVDRAEGRLQRRHHVAEALRVLGIHLDVEHVDAGEFLEQDGLALHHRLAGERADIAEAQHGGAVGDHRRPGCRARCSRGGVRDRRRWPRRRRRRRANRPATGRAGWPCAWSARSPVSRAAAAGDSRAPPCGSRRPSAAHPRFVDRQDERRDTHWQRTTATLIASGLWRLRKASPRPQALNNSLEILLAERLLQYRHVGMRHSRARRAVAGDERERNAASPQDFRQRIGGNAAQVEVEERQIEVLRPGDSEIASSSWPTVAATSQANSASMSSISIAISASSSTRSTRRLAVGIRCHVGCSPYQPSGASISHTTPVTL